MDETLIGKTTGAPGPEKSRGPARCSACGGNLEPRAIFCPRCGPPPALAPDPEFDSEPRGEAYLKITALVLVFSLVTLFKLDISLDDLLPDTIFTEEITPENKKATDDDFTVHNTVNVGAANIREKPSVRSAIVSVAQKNDALIILETQGRWTKVKHKDKIGWISSKLLTSEVR